MGNYLNTPKTEKHTNKGEGNSLKYGVSSMQGWRLHMEDEHKINLMIPNLPNFSFFSVFDGHGGNLVSKYSALYIEDTIQEHINNDKINKLISNESLHIDLLGDILTQTYLSIDKKLLLLPEILNGLDHSGTTALSSFITKNHIVVANTGDSRAVLAKNGKTIPMSFDHKPENLEEKKRIEKAGGMIRNKRVNGDLAFSRSLGDFTYKDKKELLLSEQQISPYPDIKIEKINGTEEFLVLACDGIWDVMSNDALCSFIRNLLLIGEKDIGLIAEEVLDHCLQLRSHDNMSIIIILFNGAIYGTGDGVIGLRKKREEKGIEIPVFYNPNENDELRIVPE